MNFIHHISVTDLKVFFTRGNERTVKAKKNIAASFIIKGLSIVIHLLLIPLTLNYLNPTKYGIWITLFSIISWFTFFDIGLGNGLRNKFAEAIAKGEKEKARIYVSTTYGILSIIVLILFIVFFIANYFVDWTVILNAPAELKNELSTLAIIVFGFFCLSFVIQLIGTILTADQKPAIKNLFNLLSNLTALAVIYVLAKTTSGSLIYLGITVSAAPVVVFFIASIVFYKKNYKEFIPSLKLVDFKYAKDLMSLGLQFFIIQISMVIIMSTDNLIISHLFGPAEVTPYFIAYKYFGITALIFAVINAPFWSAYTEAYQKGDFDWIKNINTKLKKIWLIMTFLGLVLLFLSNFIYRIWIGTDIYIPFLLSVVMFLYFAEFNLANIYFFFVNGVGKIKLQLIFYIITGILNIPLSIFFAKNLNLGVTGVILASSVCLLFGPTIIAIQYSKLIKGNATGIWNK